MERARPMMPTLLVRLVETRTWPCADEDERLPMARLRPLVTMRRAMASAMKKIPLRLMLRTASHSACANRSRKGSRIVDVSVEPAERGISRLDDTLRVAAGGDKTHARRMRSNGSQWR